MLRITFRKEENEKGLAAVCQSPRGYYVCVNKVPVALCKVYLNNKRFYWYILTNSLNIPGYNSLWHKITFATMEEAKADAKAYVQKYVTKNTGS